MVQILCSHEDIMNDGSAEAIPAFGRDFEAFLSFLGGAAAPTILSPRRFCLLLSMDLQALAAAAHVHRNTISRAPAAESVQRYLRDAVRILRIGTEIAGSVEKSLFWFKNSPLPVFDYKPPQTMVSEGRTDDLVRYLLSLDAGFAG